MSNLPHLTLDLTVEDTPSMLFSSFPTPPTIDEVIKNELTAPTHAPDYFPGNDYKFPSPRGREPVVQSSFNRTAPLSPAKTHSNTLSSNTHSSGDRSMTLRDSTAPSYTSQEDRRLHSTTGQGGRNNTLAQTLEQMEEEDQLDKPAIRKPSHANFNSNTRVENRNPNVYQNQSLMTNFFSREVFQVVLHNPTTAHRFLRFCQSRACGENMEFLHKVEKFTRLVDEMQRLLGDIHSNYTSTDAPRQINITYPIRKDVSAEVKRVAQHVLPGIECVFTDAQLHIENLLASDTYPRFVKHQITTQATLALATQRESMQGLGDCFCLTDPSIADNPIVFASDGFVLVTGYSRKEIVPRNCRFLQGDLTDHDAVRRLKTSIDGCEETVELLLNYRKNGDPFWNLLYVAPLFNERGEISFFLGGQINCSTTIHSCTDVLRILSVNDDELDQIDAMRQAAQSPTQIQGPKPKSSFFKSYKKYNPQQTRLNIRDEAGMEQELLSRVGRLNFKVQVEAFYTAYSKYIVMSFDPSASTLIVQHYSLGVIDMLCLNLPNGGMIPIFNKDIFKVLSEHSSSSSGTQKTYRETVKKELKAGKAVSVDIGLLTGIEQKKSNHWFGGNAKGETLRRVEEKYVSHWTPLKDEEGRSRWVVLTIAPKI